MAGNRDPRRGGGQQPRGHKPGPASSARASRPASPAVYRRRRLAVVLAALLVVLLAAAGGFGLARVISSTAENANRSPAAGAAPTPSGSDAGAGDAAEGDGEVGKDSAQDDAAQDGADAEPERNVCPAETISVEASTDSPVYAAGTSPLLRLGVTNTGSEPCEINVGTSQMEFLVTSGSDRIFSSVDCQEGGEDLWKEFEPGAVETAVMVWERTRTSPGCTPVPSNPAPGYYVLTVSLGGTASPKAVFELE